MKKDNFNWLALAGAVAFAAALGGCSGQSQQPTPGQTPAPTTGAGPGAVGAGPGSGQPGAGLGFGASPGGQRAAANRGPGVVQVPGAAAVAGAAPPNHRVDPFKPWWAPPPPPNVLTFTSPVRVARTDTGKQKNQPNIEIREVPTRRVAGILSGNGVYALLDSGGGSMQVVKPGDPVDDYHVDSITAEAVVLKKVVKFGDSTQTYTQVVPLTDVGSDGQQQFSGMGMGGIGGRMGPGGPRGGGSGGSGGRGQGGRGPGGGGGPGGIN